MQYINGQVALSLEEHLDIKSFDLLHTDIIRTISECNNHIQTSHTPHITFFDKSLKSFYEEREKNKQDSKFSNMSIPQIDLYTRLDSSATLGSQLIIRANKGYPATYKFKHLDEYSVNMPWANKFDFLLEWVKSQGCFDEFGRTMFWINEPAQRTVMHTDYGNALSQKKDMFIWITGINTKSLIFYDDDKNEEIISNHRACIFNNNNWHSSRGHPKFTSWSLRVDGVFNKAWAKKAGLDTYFNL